MKTNNPETHGIFSEFEGASLRCKHHPEENVERFCDNCDTYVCFECVVDQHCGHKLKKFQDIMKSRKDKLRQMTVGTKENVLQDLIMRQKRIRKNRKDYISGVETVKKEIQRRGNEVKELIDKRCDVLIEEIFVKQNEYLSQMEELETKLMQTVTFVDNIVLESEKILVDGNVLEIEERWKIHMNYNATDILSELHVPSDTPPIFIDHQIEDKMEEIFGSIQDEYGCGSDFTEEDDDSLKNISFDADENLDKPLAFQRDRYKVIHGRRKQSKNYRHNNLHSIEESKSE